LLTHNDFTDTRKLAEKADGFMALHQLHAQYITAVAITTAAEPLQPDLDTVGAAFSCWLGCSKGGRKKF
jgi:hypothetical protein